MPGQNLHPASGMATEGQKLAEQRAIKLCASPAVRYAKARISALFHADSSARFPNQQGLIVQSVNEHFCHAALMAASETPRSPHIIWSLAPAHGWMGLDMPGSRFGQDNPDNCYRIATIDAGLQYRISGRFVREQPGDFSICALPGQIGDNMIADVLSIISRDAIDIDADGGFAITLDATPQQGRRNHLCIAGARTIQVRDTLVDWAAERPSHLHIERTDGPAVDDYEEANAAARAAQLGETIARVFLDKVQKGMFESRPVNTVETPMASAGRGGLVTQIAAVGHFELAEDEALVLTADLCGARYLGVQLADMWMLSYDYWTRLSSLNHRQAAADADGRIRMVITPRDPGVYNWLDASGHVAGCILMRWQYLPASADLTGMVSTQLVEWDKLHAILPPETRKVDAAGRAEQRQIRLREYQNRIR